MGRVMVRARYTSNIRFSEDGANLTSVTQGVFAGALLGGALSTISLYAPGFMRYGGFVTPDTSISVIVWIFAAATMIWLTGLVLLGGPLWAVIHMFRDRSRPAIIALGFCAVFFAAFAEMTNNFSLAVGGWSRALQVAAFFGLHGAVVGFVFWQFAYRVDR